LILLDFSQTNYSSARAALLQAYRSFKRRQRFVKTNVIQRFHNRRIVRRIASGDLPPIANINKLKFFPPRWAWVDPLKEILAKLKAVSAGAGTLEELIEEGGNSAETIFDIRENELKILRDKMVPTTTAPDNLGPVSGGKLDKEAAA